MDQCRITENASKNQIKKLGNSYSILSEVIIARFCKLLIFSTIRAKAFNYFWSINTIHHSAYPEDVVSDKILF